MHHGAEVAVVFLACATLAVGAALRRAATRTGFPYTIAVLLAGLAVGLALERSQGSPHGAVALVARAAHVTPDLILFVFLPPWSSSRPSPCRCTPSGGASGPS